MRGSNAYKRYRLRNRQAKEKYEEDKRLTDDYEREYEAGFRKKRYSDEDPRGRSRSPLYRRTKKERNYDEEKEKGTDDYSRDNKAGFYRRRLLNRNVNRVNRVRQEPYYDKWEESRERKEFFPIESYRGRNNLYPAEISHPKKRETFSEWFDNREKEWEYNPIVPRKRERRRRHD